MKHEKQTFPNDLIAATDTEIARQGSGFKKATGPKGKRMSERPVKQSIEEPWSRFTPREKP